MKLHFGRRWQAMVFAFSAAIIFAGLAGAWRLPGLAEIDLSTSRDLQRLRTPGLDAIMSALTWLGAVEVDLPLALLVAAALYAVCRPREALAALLSLVALPLNLGLKLIANRPRPGNPVEVLTLVSGTSFPSGHAMVSATVYGTFAAIAWTLRPSKLVVATILAIPLLVGVSRIYLGAHWGYDVLAGWAAGALCVAAITAWLRRSRVPLAGQNGTDVGL